MIVRDDDAVFSVHWLFEARKKIDRAPAERPAYHPFRTAAARAGYLASLAEREKRAVIATSEGKQQEQINLANGARAAAIAKSEGEKQALREQALLRELHRSGAVHAHGLELQARARADVTELDEAPAGTPVPFRIDDEEAVASRSGDSSPDSADCAHAP